MIVLEADLPEDEKRHLFHQADLLRQCGNELLGIMKRNLDQLLRTKKYRGLRKSYREDQQKYQKSTADQETIKCAETTSKRSAERSTNDQ